MNWMPIKHTLFVNRSNAGTFSMQLRPSNHRDKQCFSVSSEGVTFEECLGHIEHKVKAIRIARGEG